MTNPFTTPTQRWAAVSTRNSLSATSFIYSVVTTRIYCRPTCPSRLARRSNIIFHDNAAAAEADGFRPCKRCCPDVDGEEGMDAGEVGKGKRVVEKAVEILRREVRDNDAVHGVKNATKWSVKALAKEVGLTESHFCRVFKRRTGMTVKEFRASLLESDGRNSQTREPGVEETVPIPIVDMPLKTVQLPLQQSDDFDFNDYIFVQNVDGVLGLDFGTGDLNMREISLQPFLDLSVSNLDNTVDDGMQFFDFSSCTSIEHANANINIM